MNTLQIYPEDIVNNIKSKDILQHIYNMGAHSRENLFAKKIQKWYRSYININYNNELTKSEILRTINSQYIGHFSYCMVNYPTFSTNKVFNGYGKILPVFTGDINKRSDVLQWIRKNMTAEDLNYVGI